MIEAPCVLTCVARYTVGTFHLYIYKKEMTEGEVSKSIAGGREKEFQVGS